jgi:hypothetical protein
VPWLLIRHRHLSLKQTTRTAPVRLRPAWVPCTVFYRVEAVTLADAMLLCYIADLSDLRTVLAERAGQP